jgi:hypothetical protein
MIAIDKNIPIPSRVRNRVYPLNKMEVGDSFFKEIDENKSKHYEKQKIYMAVWRHCQNHSNKKFTTASEENGVRVWRIQ